MVVLLTFLNLWPIIIGVVVSVLELGYHVLQAVPIWEWKNQLPA